MRIAAAVVAALALCAGLCAGMPYTTQQQQQQATTPGAFIGEGINNIAAALLQDPEAPGNAAYSPLGYSAILAALAEGASGKTRSQMLAALKLPQDSSLTRATYRLVLSRMKEKNALSKPEFRSWFYVYAKSTKIEDPYLAVLKEHYLMEVRDIQEAEKDTPTEFFINKEEAAPAAPATPAAAPAAPAAPDTPAAPAAAPAPAEEVKDPVVAPMAEAVAKPSEDLQPPMPVRDQVMAEAAPAAEAAAVPELPKLDEIVPLKEELKPAEDAGKAEVLEAAPLEEAAPAPAQVAEAAADTGVHQEDTAKVGEAATSQGEEEGLNLESEAQPAEVELAEKISLAKYKDEKKPTGDKKKGDKKGREESEDVNGRQPSSGPALLTSFNALYYKGEWQEPFDAKFKDDFYVAEGVQKEVTTLRTQGSFRIGDIKELNATAVELPYKGENGRYSLLVLLPRARDGLAKLTENLSKYSFRYLAKNLREKQVDVAIPEFELDCITHPQAVFRKLGMTAMLDKEAADFPGISKKRVYLQDDAMAQLVRFKVDDKNAVANYLTAMSMSTRSGLNVFHANHPFVFYLRDNLDNLTIVVGKVVDPTVRPDTSALDEAQAQAEVQLPPEPQEAQEALEEQARL